jgi:hypothetical protein
MIEDVYYTGWNLGSAGEYHFTIDIIRAGWREEAANETGIE